MEQDEWSKISTVRERHQSKLVRWLLQLVQLPSSDNATQSTAAAGLVGLKSQPQSLKSHLEMTVDESKHEAAESVKWTYLFMAPAPRRSGAPEEGVPQPRFRRHRRGTVGHQTAWMHARAAPWPEQARDDLQWA